MDGRGASVKARQRKAMKMCMFTSAGSSEGCQNVDPSVWESKVGSWMLEATGHNKNAKQSVAQCIYECIHGT